ncbi:hypothetical protein EG832_09040, partial [bacterium]|nr:hypothetical protein [bacterium]
MKRKFNFLLAAVIMVTACKPVDLTLPVPDYETRVNPDDWVTVPAGDFLAGQFDETVAMDSDYQIMVTDVTVAQYVNYLNSSLADGTLRLTENKVTVFYPGDFYQGAKHEIRIEAGDYIVVPLDDPSSPYTFDGEVFSSKVGWQKHPMVNVSWFGA